MTRVILRSLTAQDLLSFKSLDFRIRNGLNVLVGQNDVGKSNLLRLIKLAKDLLAGFPGPADYGFERRYVRLDGPGVGELRLHLGFTETREQDLLLLYIRAVAASLAHEGLQGSPAKTPAEQQSQPQRIAAHIESSLDRESVVDLFHGWVVVTLDGRQPYRWSLSYEFEWNNQRFNVGIQGNGIASDWVVPGRFRSGQNVWTGTQPELRKRFSEDQWQLVTFRDLLPGEGQGISWALSSQNQTERPLTLALARELGIAADNSRVPTLGLLLRTIVGQALTATENIRRPPRRQYSLAAAGEGLAVDDAGDLPLELYRRKIGPADERERYEDLQTRSLEMTGRHFDLSAQVIGPPNGTAPAELDVELQVKSGAGWVPMDQAGAGLWDALVSLAVAVPQSGQVALLDEPASNLHSSWQLRLLRYLKDHPQVLMVTHSPFLVPADDVNDFSRVTRLAPGAGGVLTVGIGDTGAPARSRERWRQLFAGSTDARNVLFSRGVVLVEGDTELGAFRRWFNRLTELDGANVQGADARNVMIVSVDGDLNFGVWLNYLDRMNILWAIIADGPVLSPAGRHSLLRQMRAASLKTAGDMPGSASDFEGWQRFWKQNGVFTLAQSFGLESLSARSRGSGEIERWFATVAPQAWKRVARASRSKVRRGYRFAEEVDPRSDEGLRESLVSLWADLVGRVGS